MTQDDEGNLSALRLTKNDVIVKGYKDSANYCLSQEVVQASGRLDDQRSMKVRGVGEEGVGGWGRRVMGRVREKGRRWERRVVGGRGGWWVGWMKRLVGGSVYWGVARLQEESKK